MCAPGFGIFINNPRLTTSQHDTSGIVTDFNHPLAGIDRQLGNSLIENCVVSCTTNPDRGNARRHLIAITINPTDQPRDRPQTALQQTEKTLFLTIGLPRILVVINTKIGSGLQ